MRLFDAIARLWGRSSDEKDRRELNRALEMVGLPPNWGQDQCGHCGKARTQTDVCPLNYKAMERLRALGMAVMVAKLPRGKKAPVVLQLHDCPSCHKVAFLTVLSTRPLAGIPGFKYTDR